MILETELDHSVLLRLSFPKLMYRFNAIPIEISVALQGVDLFSYKYVQFSSVAQSCLTLCDPMDCSTPSFPIHHQLP